MRYLFSEAGWLIFASTLLGFAAIVFNYPSWVYFPFQGFTLILFGTYFIHAVAEEMK